jgi:proline dehydrogenase
MTKVGEKQSLSNDEQVEWNKVIERFDLICKTAHDKDVALLIDAEESWMQDAADDLVEEMMRKYNKEKVIVFNTLQMYRWDRLDYLKALHERAKTQGFYIGMKLVRGAYMEKETSVPKKMDIQRQFVRAKKQPTTIMMQPLDYMMKHIDTMAIFAGTHNEESSYKLMNYAEQMLLLKTIIEFGLVNCME